MSQNRTRASASAEMDMSYLNEDTSWQLLLTSFFFTIILTAFFIMYTVSRIMKDAGRRTEVWLYMPAGYVFCVGNCLIGLLFVTIGGAGRHLEFHKQAEPDFDAFFSRVRKLKLAAQLVYAFSFTLPKLAIISLYLRIFVTKWARRGAYLTNILIIGNFLGITIGTLSICRPIASIWDDTVTNKVCGDISLAFLYVSVPNIFIDILILILPISTLMKVRASPSKKIGLYITVMTGSLGVITAIIRMVYIIRFRTGTDLTYIIVKSMMWTIIEPAAYFMCASMPDMRPLLQTIRKLSGTNIVMSEQSPSRIASNASTATFADRVERKNSWPEKI